MKLKFSIILFIISIFNLNAQNTTDAEKVINQLIQSVRTTAIRTNFKIVVSEKNALNSQSVTGVFTLKGNKFMLDMENARVWFDGKTQWSYNASDNEVSITEPGPDELAGINPMVIIAGFKQKSVAKFSRLKSAVNYIIELTPAQSKAEFKKVEVHINKSNGNLVMLKLTDKKALVTTLTLTNYQKVNNITDKSFTFDKSKFKNVIINDLR